MAFQTIRFHAERFGRAEKIRSLWKNSLLKYPPSLPQNLKHKKILRRLQHRKRLIDLDRIRIYESQKRHFSTQLDRRSTYSKVSANNDIDQYTDSLWISARTASHLKMAPPRKKFWDQFSAAMAVSLSLLAFASAIIGGYLYIESRIDNALSDPSRLEKIAENLRPEMIVDFESKILNDRGASKYIKDFTFETTGNSRRLIVETTRFMAIEPLVTVIDAEFIVKQSRGAKNTIIYDILPRGILMTEQGASPPRYFVRIEIIDR